MLSTIRTTAYKAPKMSHVATKPGAAGFLPFRRCSAAIRAGLRPAGLCLQDSLPRRRSSASAPARCHLAKGRAPVLLRQYLLLPDQGTRSRSAWSPPPLTRSFSDRGSAVLLSPSLDTVHADCLLLPCTVPHRHLPHLHSIRCTSASERRLYCQEIV